MFQTNMKKVYFELIRVLACCLVIYNHLPGYRLYEISKGWKQFFYMCLTMITRINVPLFLMISGALLLCREEKLFVVIKKRFIRILLVLVLFDFILMTINKYISIKNGTEYEYSLYRFLRGFLNNGIGGDGAYWYMYSYLGILIVLPLLQRIAKELSKQEIAVLLFLHFISSSVLPIVNIILTKLQVETISLSGDFQVPFAFTKPLFYLLIGYYIEYYVDTNKMTSQHIIGLMFAAVIGIMISNWCTYMGAALNGQTVRKLAD